MRGDRTKILHLPMYANYLVRMVVTSDLSRYARKHKLGEIGPQCGAFTATADDGSCWIVVRPKASASIVAHECWHATKGIAEFIGAELEDEFTAYLIGHLTAHVHSFAHGNAHGN